MKKDEFKKSIDSINPDAYMGNRIKAKINSDLSVRSNRRVTVSITAFCLAFAIVFGVGFITQPTIAPTTTQQNTTKNEITQNKRINPFIMVASAANAESSAVATENKVLELNEEYPYKMYLEVRDISGVSDEEKTKNVSIELEIFKEKLENVDFYRGMTYINEYENIALGVYIFNDFKLDLKDTENIKSINVKNNSKYGEMVFNENKPVFNAPEHGNDITISGEDFDFEKSSFYWDCTEKVEKAFNENINTPFSTFNDTITFTVEYNDGSKAVGVVDLVFDDSGNAKVVCRNYDYVVQ